MYIYLRIGREARSRRDCHIGIHRYAVNSQTRIRIWIAKREARNRGDRLGTELIGWELKRQTGIGAYRLVTEEAGRERNLQVGN